MTFNLRSSGGNYVGAEWIAAEGEIIDETADDLERYLKSFGHAENPGGWSVRFNSRGGTLPGGIRLGELIRKLKLNTEIGGTEADGLHWKRVTGCCASACAFAYLGGLSRDASGGELGVHQFHDEISLRDPSAKIFNSLDMSQHQFISAMLIDYTFRMGVDRPTPTQSLLDALLDVGEKVMAIDWSSGTFQASPQSAWLGLVNRVLAAWGAAEAGVHLLESFRSADSTSLCASLFVQRARELGKMPDDHGDQPTITVEALDALGTILSAKIEKDVADGELQRAPRIWDIVRAWKYLGGAPEAKIWLNKSMFESAAFMSRVTEGFVSYTVGSEPRRYRMRDRPDQDLYDLRSILDAAKKHLEGNELTEDARNRISVVAEKVEGQLAIDCKDETRKSTASETKESDEGIRGPS